MRFSIKMIMDFYEKSCSTKQNFKTNIEYFYTITDYLQPVFEEILGIEIDKLHLLLPGFEEVILKNVKKHPNADLLKTCSIDEKTVVCGDESIQDGDRCILANPGTIIPCTGRALVKSKIRDVESEGMLCSAGELLIESSQNGVLKLKEGESVLEKLMLNGPILEVSITPNRGDLLSIYGIAREVLPFFPEEKIILQKKCYRKYVDSGQMPDLSESSIKINLNSIKSMYFLKINGISQTESPVWLKRYLFEMGLSSESIVSDICKYITNMYGQPISIFDANTLQDLSFKKLSEVDFEDQYEKKFVLKDVLCMFSDSQCAQICGITEAKWAKYSKDTKNILLQVGNYSREEIFISESQIYTTDASKRFSYGIDPEMSTFCLYEAGAMIKKLCGGEIEFVECAKKEIIERKKFKIDKIRLIDNLKERKLNEEDKKNLLRAGFEEVGTEEYSPPSWRHDIVAEECFETEIIKYNSFQNKDGNLYYYRSFYDSSDWSPPVLSGTGRIKSKASELRTILSTFGLYESFTRHFMSKSMNDLFQQDEIYILKNPMNQGQFCLRNSLLPSLLEVFSSYKRYNWQSAGIFEIGKIFTKDGETEAVGVAIPKRSDWLSGRFDYFNAKYIFEAIVKFLYGDSLTVEGEYDPIFINCCNWKNSEKNTIARFGEVDPELQKKMKCKENFYFGEIIINSKSKAIKTREIIEDYEVINRDISIMMKPDLPTSELIYNLSSKLGKDIEIELFDIYPDAKLSNPERSIGIRLAWSNLTRTLSSEEINSTLEVAYECINATGCRIKEN